MAKFVHPEKISLKKLGDVNEKAIQDYLFDNPSVLGLGDLLPLRKEKTQPQGGRLDLLFGDEDNLRYEIELQLGETDPSHIIRTIEYWDAERKRYPQYDHCAVIIAEEITGRFMNVISLFNGAIPLIALQMNAHKQGDNIALTFTKVLDRVSYATDDEEEFEPVDRSFWEKKTPKKVMAIVDEIYEDLPGIKDNYSLKYNKAYIGLAQDGVAKNCIYFKPKKSFLAFFMKCLDCEETENLLSDAGLDATADPRHGRVRIRFKNVGEYKENRNMISEFLAKWFENNE